MRCVYLTGITSRRSPVRISPIHTYLYHGWYHEQKIGGPRVRYVATNVDAPVVRPSAGLVVAPPILESLRRIRPVDAQATDILAAFSHRIDLGDGLEDRFTNALTHSTTRTEHALYKYLKKHAMEVEKPALFDVHPVRGWTGKWPGPVVYTVANDGVPRRRDRQHHSVAEIVFGDFPSNKAPIESRDLDFDPGRLDEYGVVVNWGYVFLPEMFEVIAPHVDNPYFYVEEFEV